MDCTADKAEMSPTKVCGGVGMGTKKVFILQRDVSEEGDKNSSGLNQTKPTTSKNWQQRYVISYPPHLMKKRLAY